jgi:hypothetical protein
MASGHRAPASLSVVSPPPAPSRSRYPLGVVVVMVIAALRCVTIVATFIGPQDDNAILDWLVGSSPVPSLDPASDLGVVVRAVLIGILVASVLIVVGLLAHRRWAWVLAIVTSGLILALDLGWWFSGRALYGSMLLNVIAVFYLNQPDVRTSLSSGLSRR